MTNLYTALWVSIVVIVLYGAATLLGRGIVYDHQKYLDDIKLCLQTGENYAACDKVITR